ncbi:MULTISPECIES: hypothetical protein [unclassified Knoellia]|uniref:hypothetical protein n=1 Tax=Knoellia altitudinis TaxID=3404795 RepID=UPI003612EE01
MSAQDDDLDPTGMRALLRGLPDPGPMPDDLVRRIHASLAEQPALEGETHASPEGVSRGTPTHTRRSWWSRHAGHAAVAAVVLLGGGALVSGQLGLLDRQSGVESTAGGAVSDSAASDAESFTGSPPDADASGPQDSDLTTTGKRLRDADPGAVVVRQSGRAYTAAALRTQLDEPASAPPVPPLTAEAPSIGPIGTELGVRSCLEALGLPRATAAEVDLAVFDGAPAAVVIVTVGGERTAYAVARDCTTDNPAVLAGPVALP